MVVFDRLLKKDIRYV